MHRVIFCVIMGIILLGSQVGADWYISSNLNDEFIPYDTNNDELVESYFDDSLYMVKTARGYYGIVNANGSEVISPVWNSIEVLSEDRFIVSRVLSSASIAVGILDNYENMIVPLLFNSISKENDFFRVGTLNENGKKILFDKYGNIQLYKEWDSCEIDDDTAKVKQDNVTALITADSDGVCSYTSLYIPTSILDKDFSVTVKNPVSDGKSALDDYESVVSELSTYCEAIFNSDAESIRSITTSQYYNSLISNMLPDCQLNHISNVSVHGQRDDDLNGAVVYYADINLAYTSNTTVLDGSPSKEMNTLLLSLQFVRSQEGDIVVRSAEKVLTTEQTQNDDDDEQEQQEDNSNDNSYGF
jgi:hypothetical protein